MHVDIHLVLPNMPETAGYEKGHGMCRGLAIRGGRYKI